MSKIYLYSLLFFSISCFSVNPPLTDKDLVVKWPLDLKTMMVAVCKLSSKEEGNIVITSRNDRVRLASIPRKNIPQERAKLFAQLALDDSCNYDESEAEKYQVLEKVCKDSIGLLAAYITDLFEQKTIKAIQEKMASGGTPFGAVSLEKINTQGTEDPVVCEYPYNFGLVCCPLEVKENGELVIDILPEVRKFARETAEKHMEVNSQVVE